MFLKSLTLRGFKSFAERTTLDLEPGITVIVGPNGSGKSNVVDALAWVLGTRSAKLLRGGELADVIFAGSPAHPPLHRAKVEITIDNSFGQLGDGALGVGGSAQGFSEVTISREITNDGESVYAINGAECRLLDIQELLSDTGLGRELHTIVGQGQLDAILHARPEDRRAFVEEAAGILKHRRRRERAQRKLEHVDDHLERLGTVLRELRRQMRPLERQAEAANRHKELQEELRGVRLRLAAHDHARLRAVLDAVESGDADVAERHGALERAVAAADERIGDLESRLRQATPAVDAARDAVADLRQLHERLRGTADLVAARRRHLLEYVEEPLAGRPPDELRAQAADLDELRSERESELAEARETLASSVEERRVAERARREHDEHVADVARSRAEARERRARWEGERDARRRAIEQVEGDLQRVGQRHDEAAEREAELLEAVEVVRTEITELDVEERRLTERLEEAESAVADRRERLEAATARAEDLERRRSAELARAEALRTASSASGQGTEQLAASPLEGLSGLLADHLRIEAGAEAAVAAALGPLGDAVLADSLRAAGAAIAHLRRDHGGRAVVMHGDRSGEPREPTAVPEGARPLVDAVAGRDGGAALAALRRALHATYLVDDWTAALALHERHPEATFVTAEGDLVGPRGVVGGSDPEGSVVLAVAAAEEAERRAEQLAGELEEADDEVAEARAALDEDDAVLASALAEIHASDAAITGAAEELARLNKQLASVRHERESAGQQRDELAAALRTHREALAELADGPEDPEPQPVTAGDVAELDEELERARTAELEARLAAERLAERVRHLEEGAASLRDEADQVEAALADAARRRELRRRQIRRCGELDALCAEAIEAIGVAIADAEAERDRRVAERSEVTDELDRARGEHRDLVAELDEVREHRHATELRRAEARRDLDELAARVADRFDLALDELAADHGESAADADRDALVEREDTLVRKLGMLGRINPLALEEFQALEERHRFLGEQIDDLRRSRRDLEEVITAVDGKIEEVFAEAFEDVAREFTDVFDRVFPGGDGRLVLTEPDDLLTTGIEIEARPPGKRIRRLSLLSGGERSLTALAFLFAIFRARPSPFYVLDEVEAALDDVNLHRLLGVIEEFKTHAQLLVVTHQKRTMEVGDILYGVSMGEDAVSKVVSERLGEPVHA